MLCALTVAVSWAQPNPWPSLPFTGPLRFSSLPLEGAQAIAPPPGEWQVADTLSYVNVWQLRWHTGTIHNRFGLLGRPLTDREVRIREKNSPRDQSTAVV
jgi:hypothetical protein